MSPNDDKIDSIFFFFLKLHFPSSSAKFAYVCIRVRLFAEYHLFLVSFL
jgi:hypothetical protein